MRAVLPSRATALPKLAPAVPSLAVSFCTWSQMQKLTASDGTAGANFGNAVALDGSTALIGADASTVEGNTYQGKAYLFTESGGNWSQSDTFIASDGTVDDYFGAAL